MARPSAAANHVNGHSGPFGSGSSLKVVVRRLPPGLTQDEFEAALGHEWVIQGGRINWLSYCPGKISTELSKPSRPSRAYLRLIYQSFIPLLVEKVSSTVFRDAKNSAGDVALIAPPCVEISPYPRVPSGRRRADPRQGTIDKDPDFVAFLDHLAAPAPKPKPIEPQSLAKIEKITTTSLIDDLREKKAKFGSLRDAKNSRIGSGVKKGRLDDRADKRKTELTKEPVVKTKKKRDVGTNEAITILSKINEGPGSLSTRRTATLSRTSRPAKTDDRSSADPPGATGTTPRGLRSRTAVVDDPASSRLSKREAKPRRACRGKHGDEDATTDSARPLSASTGTSKPVQPRILKRASTTLDSGSTTVGADTIVTHDSGIPPSEPAAMRQTPPPATGTLNASHPHAQSQSSSEPSRQAFIKNVSAGSSFTTASLKQVLGAFGQVTKTEVERRKGHGYAEFAEPSGLTAALRGNPISCGSGTITVAVRRGKPSNPTSTVSGSISNGIGGNTSISGSTTGLTSKPRGGRTGNTSKLGKPTTSESTSSIIQTESSEKSNTKPGPDTISSNSVPRRRGRPMGFGTLSSCREGSGLTNEDGPKGSGSTRSTRHRGRRPPTGSSVQPSRPKLVSED